MRQWSNETARQSPMIPRATIQCSNVLANGRTPACATDGDFTEGAVDGVGPCGVDLRPQHRRTASHTNRYYTANAHNMEYKTPNGCVALSRAFRTQRVPWHAPAAPNCHIEFGQSRAHLGPKCWISVASAHNPQQRLATEATLTPEMDAAPSQYSYTL